MANQGLFSFSGIDGGAWESFTITDSAGISPAVGFLEFYTIFGTPDEDGDIVLTYDDETLGLQTIRFKDCHIDSVNYKRGTNGTIAQVRFIDERWTWAFGSISGRYNIRLPSGWVDPDHEMTPQELVQLCFEALGYGEEEFDLSDLPNDARPDIDWENANPAQEMARICDDLGCRIVPIRSEGTWKVCVTGEGNDLPDIYPWQDTGKGIDPKETPDYIKIVTAPIRFQVALYLSPIGRDVDQAWKPLKYLSYCPDPSGTIYNAWGFDPKDPNQSNCDPTRVIQADGTAISPQELAISTVFKSFRVEAKDQNKARKNEEGTWEFYVDAYDDYVSTKQLILSSELVQSYVDFKGEEHKRPALIFGSFNGAKVDGINGANYPSGTRIDFQGPAFQIDEEERASFGLSLDPIDTTRSIVTISRAMCYDYSKLIPGQFFGICRELFLTCTINIRDPDTWEPVRYEYLYQIGEGDNEEFCCAVTKDDIAPYYISEYDSKGTFIGSTDNQTDVDKACLSYAKSIAKTFEIIDSMTRTYIGLYPIDMDGAINQVSYRLGKSGFDTTASRGTEHDFDIPTYDEKLQRTARTGDKKRDEYFRYRIDRLKALQGSFNTI